MPRELERIDLTGISRAEWRELRRIGIGGSDAGAIMGVSKYATALDIYESKVNPQADRDESAFSIGGSSEAAFHGTNLEGYVADCFAAEFGADVRVLDELLIYRGNGFPMTANLDRVAKTYEADEAVLECKTAGLFSRKDWANDGVPPAYLYQVLHYLEVTGWDTAYLAVLIGGQKFEYRTVYREDHEFDIEEMVERERALWACVEANEPPEEEF